MYLLRVYFEGELRCLYIYRNMKILQQHSKNLFGYYDLYKSSRRTPFKPKTARSNFLLSRIR